MTVDLTDLGKASDGGTVEWAQTFDPETGAYQTFYLSFKQGSMKRFTSLPTQKKTDPLTNANTLASLLDGLTSMSVRSITTTCFLNKKVDIPADPVGPFVTKKLRFRVTHPTVPSESQVVTINVPGFSPQSGLTEAQIMQQIQLIGNCIGVYTNNDIVEYLG